MCGEGTGSSGIAKDWCGFHLTSPSDEIRYVGGEKTDVAGERKPDEQKHRELNPKATNGYLARVSGLVVTNGKELEILEAEGAIETITIRTSHEGKRSRLLISRASLKLKKVETRHSKYTLWLNLDDKEYQRRRRPG